MTDREAALGAAFAAHADGVAAAAFRVLRDAEAARDAAQEAFVRFYERIDEVRGDPGAWLRAVATRVALDRLRRARRDDRARAAISARGPLPGLDPGPDPLVEAERRARVLEAIADLPPRQRDVVRLRVLEGETFPAVARALGIAEGSAKEHLRRALETLRRALGKFVRD